MIGANALGYVLGTLWGWFGCVGHKVTEARWQGEHSLPHKSELWQVNSESGGADFVDTM